LGIKPVNSKNIDVLYNIPNHLADEPNPFRPVYLLRYARRVARGEDLGDKSPLAKKFFNFLGFLRGKIQKKFLVSIFSYKKFENTLP